MEQVSTTNAEKPSENPLDELVAWPVNSRNRTLAWGIASKIDHLLEQSKTTSIGEQTIYERSIFDQRTGEVRLLPYKVNFDVPHEPIYLKNFARELRIMADDGRSIRLSRIPGFLDHPVISQMEAQR